MRLGDSVRRAVYIRCVTLEVSFAVEFWVGDWGSEGCYMAGQGWHVRARVGVRVGVWVGGNCSEGCTWQVGYLRVGVRFIIRVLGWGLGFGGLLHGTIWQVRVRAGVRV